MVLLILESVLLAVGMGLVLLPLRRGAAGITRGVEVGGGSSPFHTGGREAARRRVLVGLAELEMDYRTGKVSDEDYRVMKDDLLARGTARPRRRP
ncbi:hypothetical protein [Limnochorda pilosa]|nr:hypothetical protein [Limnochorda pilosa]